MVKTVLFGGQKDSLGAILEEPTTTQEILSGSQNFHTILQGSIPKVPRIPERAYKDPYQPLYPKENSNNHLCPLKNMAIQLFDPIC